MGIEVAGDPHWFDNLSQSQQRSVLGLMHAEATATSKPPPARQTATATPAEQGYERTGDAAFDNLLDVLNSPDGG